MRASVCIFAVVFCIFCTVPNAMAQSVDAAKIDSLFAEFRGTNVPGAVVQVIQNGKIAFANAYGLANLEKNEPCRLETNFRLASVTKQFTSMAILLLAENGKLSLDDPLSRFFPEFREYGKLITLRQLLTHSSGLPDYEDFIPEGTKIPLSDRNVLHILSQQTKTYFPPGTEFRYSNSGYAMLALVVEIVSGQTFAAFLKRHVFEPLGMMNTLAYEAGSSRVPYRAFGYAKSHGGQFVPSDQSLTSAVLGDGGIYSSVTDLAKWDAALDSSKLIPVARLREAFTAWQPKTDMAGSGYGFGWYVSQSNGSLHVWHYGSTCGFSTRLHRFPERRLTVMILTNRRDAPLNGIPERIADLFLNPR